MGEGKEARVRERKRSDTKEGSGPNKTIGGSWGDGMVSVCTLHTSEVLEMNSIMRLTQMSAQRHPWKSSDISVLRRSSPLF